MALLELTINAHITNALIILTAAFRVSANQPRATWWELSNGTGVVPRMRYGILALGLAVLILDASALTAETPKNVKCAIQAQEKARNEGSDYQRVYNRNFELCMLRAMPRHRQTQYLIEKLKPYVAISPGLKEVSPSQDEAKIAGRWVRISPYVLGFRRLATDLAGRAIRPGLNAF